MVCFYTSWLKSPQRGSAVCRCRSKKKRKEKRNDSLSVIFNCWRRRLTVEASGFLSMRTSCVFPAFLHRQIRAETQTPSEKPCSQMPCSLPQHCCTTSSCSHGDVASYFLSISAFVGPVFVFFSSGVPKNFVRSSLERSQSQLVRQRKLCRNH